MRITYLAPALTLLTALINLPVQARDYARIDLRYPGVYRITGAELAEAGLKLDQIKPGSIALESAGKPVPVLVKSATPEHLNPTDTIEFVGDTPRGTATWFMPDNKHNVYLLTWDNQLFSSPDSPARYSAKPASASVPTTGERQRFWQETHYEKNLQFWFSTLPPTQTDNFYWAPFFANTAPKDFLQVYISTPGYDAAGGIPVSVDLHLFGATAAGGLKPSHLYDVLYDMKPVGKVEFNNISLHDTSITVPPAAVKEGPARLSFDAPADRKQAVDKIYLDWFKVRYPSRINAAKSEYYQFNNNLVAPSNPTGYTSATLNIAGLLPNSTIFDPGTLTAWQSNGNPDVTIDNNAKPTTFTIAADFARLKVDSISPVSKSKDLRAISSGTEVLVIYHPTLSKTAEAYTAYRQVRGWKTHMVDIRRIFDEYNKGYIRDQSLKDYLEEVHQKTPSVSHVVLIGDAYYDYREARSADDQKQYEVLIPIHWVYRPGVTWSGGYQDDNWYISFSNPYRPDLAIGRIAVNSDEEGLDYLKKIIEYETLKKSKTDPGLMISSVEQSFQDYVKEVATRYKDKLSTYVMLFPTAAEATLEVNALQAEINKGKQLIYYVGHGGSLVWRVGPTDFSRQKDLFTPADVAALTNHQHYPVVVCASCYTTAFDQPRSIGEALVNQKDAGAIAVIGAPWKAAVQDSHEFNRLLFQHYFDANTRTIGEASLKAHREFTPPEQKEALFNSFTLLGDPCLEIQR